MTNPEIIRRAVDHGEFIGSAGSLGSILAAEIRRLEAEVKALDLDVDGFRSLAMAADEEIIRLRAVAGSLVHALEVAHEAGEDALMTISTALAVARRAGIGPGASPLVLFADRIETDD